MNRKWMPILAGILEILAGFAVLASILFIIWLAWLTGQRPWDDPSLLLWILWMIPFIIGLLGIVSLVGGVCALMRRRWRSAFWGSISTVSLFFVAAFGWLGSWTEFDYGIAPHYFYWSPLLISAAIITLVVLSKREFR